MGGNIQASRQAAGMTQEQIAAGQSIVVYDGLECVGGGMRAKYLA
jgi:tRNA U34 2-thiouridine synthase MnmA/TrmU